MRAITSFSLAVKLRPIRYSSLAIAGGDTTGAGRWRRKRVVHVWCLALPVARRRSGWRLYLLGLLRSPGRWGPAGRWGHGLLLRGLTLCGTLLCRVILWFGVARR